MKTCDGYTPPNYQQLDDSDLDLGGTAPVMLPRQPASRTPLMARIVLLMVRRESIQS